MGPDVDTAMQRTRQYWYDDGLTEIASGCMFAAIGAMFLAEAWGLIPAGVSSIGLLVIVMGGMFLARRAVTYAKTRITYPRTGFVRYQRRPRRSRALAGGIAGFMAALVAALFVNAPASLAWIPALDGLIGGAFLLYLGHFLGLRRFYGLAALSALVGVATSLFSSGEILGSGVYFLGMSLGLLASGGVTLSGYLRSSGPVEE